MHIHIAEQIGEVDAFAAIYGARPVEWLLANAEIDVRWTLVHATHVTATKIEALARSGATVALAPTTEANLGDGLFPLRPYLSSGGAFAIGSDSNVSIDAAEELRWLEHGQRLVTQTRNVAALRPGESNGEILYRGAATGGARALGRETGAVAAGKQADFVVLAGDVDDRDDGVDRYIFASRPRAPHAVMVSGTWSKM